MEKILALIFFVSLSAMLVAGRFNCAWVGGSGYVKPLSTTIEIADGQVQITRVEKTRTAAIGDSVARGEKISTGENSRALVRIGKNITVALDQQTDIVLEQLFPTQVEIKIIRGRLLTNTSLETEKLVVTSPKATGEIIEGSVTAVRYDFLDKTAFASINGQVFVRVSDGQNFQLGNLQAIEINEINPGQSVLSEFNLQNSSAAGFYDWAERF